MGRILVVAEKPSVGRDLARVLGCRQGGDGVLMGETHVVTWAVGHLIAQAEPSAYDPKYQRWAMYDLPIQPKEWKLEIVPRTRPQYEIIKKWMLERSIDRILCATDSGREGELIFRWIYEMARCRKPVDRLWISSMTDAAIQEGLNNTQPASAYDNLYYSARSRARADWLVGFNASRAYTLRYHRNLSVGRVQTPTLALMAARQREIAAFVPVQYWEVWADFEAAHGAYTGAWIGKMQQNEEKEKEEDGVPKAARIASKEEAAALVARLRKKPAEITDIQRQEKRQPPPLLFDLTELQRESNVKFGFSAQKTLDIAQSLYERAKYITYPRTDSRYLSHDMEEKLPVILQALSRSSFAIYGELAAPLLALERLTVGSRIINDERVTDHHAIIPTTTAPRLETLNEDERAVYDLIARRFLAVFYPDQRYAITRVITTIHAKPDEPFVSKGKEILAPGWTVVLPEPIVANMLPKCEMGEVPDVRKLASKEKKTKPPTLYTEAGLLSAMEHAGRHIEDETLRESVKDSGLGTPATRASIIERLIEVGYVGRKGKSLAPTEKGMKLTEILPAELQSAETTGKWEKALAAMAKGEMTEERFMGSIERFVQYLLDDAKGPVKEVEFPPETAKPRKRQAPRSTPKQSKK